MLKSQLPKNQQDNSALFSGSRRAEGEVPLILIVEDDSDSRFMLRYMLEMWKYRVVEAENGENALSAAENFSPDLILMDVSLPDTTGFAVAERVRSCGKLSEVPIVYLSGFSRNAFANETKGVEINEYFVKPISADELKNTVGKYCGNKLKAA